VQPLPQSLRRRVPIRVRDQVRVRSLALGLGLIPPRCMHSATDARLLADAARDARCVVEIGVYEGASALVLCDALADGAELHLIDPFGSRPDALPRGWGAAEWSTRRTVARALARRRGAARAGPSVVWHIGLSHDVAQRWDGRVDLVFIDGDHTEAGCGRDWLDWSPVVAPGGRVVFHDARDARPGGRGLPGPTAVVDRYLRSAPVGGWAIEEEADRTVVARRSGPD
jgi:predicted O-methyltransferase YrrM